MSVRKLGQLRLRLPAAVPRAAAAWTPVAIRVAPIPRVAVRTASYGSLSSAASYGSLSSLRTDARQSPGEPRPAACAQPCHACGLRCALQPIAGMQPPPRPLARHQVTACTLPATAESRTARICNPAAAITSTSTLCAIFCGVGLLKECIRKLKQNHPSASCFVCD